MSVDVCTALYEVLSTAPSLVALRSTRIYPVVAPQHVDLPYQTYQVIDAPRERHMGGTAGLVIARIQINSVAATFDAMRLLDNATRLVVTPVHGWVGTAPNLLNIRDIDWQQGTLGMEGPFDGQETGPFVARSDMVVTHWEATISRS